MRFLYVFLILNHNRTQPRYQVPLRLGAKAYKGVGIYCFMTNITGSINSLDFVLLTFQIIEFVGLPAIIFGVVAFLIKKSPRISMRMQSEEEYGLHSLTNKILIVERIKGGEVRNPKYFIHFFSKRVYALPIIKSKSFMDLEFPICSRDLIKVSHTKNGTIRKYHISCFITQDIEGNIGDGLRIPIDLRKSIMLNADKCAIILYYSHPYFPIRKRVITIYPIVGGLIDFSRKNMFEQFVGFRSDGDITKERDMKVF